MADNVIVKPGVSGQSVKFNAKEVDCETLANEVALLSLGDWEGLKVKVNCGQYSKQIKEFENDWVDYLPRTDKINNRKALSLLNLPGKTHQDNPSLAQACVEADRYVNEAEFNVPTKVYNKLECLHPLLNIFPTLGRTFLIKCGEGAYFHPHRDHPTMPRDSFRIAVFLQDCGPMQFDWIHGHEKMLIEHGRPYYVNTKRVHRTMSWSKNSTHLIINVPFTSENVTALIANLQHAH